MAMCLPFGLAVAGDAVLLSDGTTLSLPNIYQDKVSAKQSVVFGFRADNLMPVGLGLTPGAETAQLDLHINLSEPLGTETILFGDIAGQEIQAKMFNPRPVSFAETLTCELVLSRCHLFDEKSQTSLR